MMDVERASERFAGANMRWVAPLEKRIPLTREGMLDAEAFSNTWYSGDRPDRADTLIGAAQSYVLLAPGGAGKTTLIQEIRGHEPQSVRIDLRMHSRDSLAQVVRSAAIGFGSVFIDALDEALQLDPNLGYILVQLLGEEDARRTSWRLACRPGSWTQDVSTGISAALPDFRQLELLPLDLQGVRQLAGSDADAFLDAVDRAYLTRQLALPLNAHDLLEQWRSTGALPATRLEAMRHTVSRLLDESGRFRPARRQDDQRMVVVAERLAAITMSCGIGRFKLGPGVVPSAPSTTVSARSAADESYVEDTAVTITAVPVDEEPDLAGAQLQSGDVREVLETSLFSAADGGSVTFVHQSYAEFLAAAYFTRRHVIGDRLVSLVGADTNGLVPGPLIEVLGWMLALGADAPAELIDQNAKQLLGTAGLELAEQQARQRIVDALLRGAANGTIDEGWGLDTSILSYPALGARLRAAIRSATTSLEIFWITRLARQCHVVDVADDLLIIARGATWPAFLRAEAVQSFAEVASAGRMTELHSLLELDLEEDPDDEILAAALRAMLDGRVDVDHVAAALRPRRNQTYIGRYAMLLGELGNLVPSADALPVLEAVLSRRQVADDLVFGRMVTSLLVQVWETADPHTLRRLGQLLGRQEEPISGVDRPAESLPWAVNDPQELRRVVAEAALLEGGASFMPVLDLRILSPADLTWLIDWMAEAPTEALETAGVVLRNLASAVADAESVDRILGVCESHPAYAALSTFHGSVEVDERPRFWKPAKIQDDQAPGREQLVATLRTALVSAQKELGTWWGCVIALAGDWTGDEDTLFSWDLTTRSLWTDLDPSEQAEFWRLALQYVEVRQPEPTRWTGRHQWKLHEVMPDWAAVYALTTAAKHRADELASLSDATWDKWAPIIVAMPSFTGNDPWPAALRSPSSRAHVALTNAVNDLIRMGPDASFAHHPLADFSDPRQLEAVTDVARNHLQPHDRRNAALAVLVERAPTTALSIARGAQDEHDPPQGAPDVLAALSPGEFLKSFLAAGASTPLASLRYIDLDRVSDEALSSLGGRLLNELPFSDDPDREYGFTPSTSAHEARRVRTHVLQEMAARGMVQQLEALSVDRPDVDVEQIRLMRMQARASEARRRWRPLEPATMMKLIAAGDARLVRDSRSLIAVLLKQLQLVQHDLYERAEFREVWDGEPGQPTSSPKVEDDISDWLAKQLRLRLSPHVVVDREVQVSRPSRSGVGTRIDISVTSAAGLELARVPIEAKRVENRSLLTALEDQLVERYMKPSRFGHGIYVVYWVQPSARPPSWHRGHRNLTALRATLQEQARRHIPDMNIDVVVLDIGPRGIADVEA